ncbi:MAG: LysM peptidoglycan-binding domain-containing protein [Proteobacteria bacterium]|nr:LysM peptidoglycan-binding domain-containing protein [Pseudomonadota bacterium]
MKKILPSLALVIAACMAAIPLLAAEVLRADHPDRYQVKEGDTLWEIASMFLTDAWMWPEIWHINPDIENPHLIYPGDEILLMYVDGEPRLSLQRGVESRTVTLKPAQPVRTGNQTEKLDPRIRISPLVSAIPAIPLDAIASLLTTGRIVEQDTLALAPHILAGTADKLIFGPGDEFYARGDWDDQTVVYGVFREGEVYQDPDTREVLGFEAREVGLARVVSGDDKLRKFVLLSVKQDVRLGDRLMPTEERRVESTFYPKPPSEQINGVIMTVLGGVTQVGRNNVVVLNRGTEHGLDVGHVLAIHKQGSVARDRFTRELVQLPSERAGILMVFRTFDKMSYGLVLQTEAPLRVGDVVVNP